MWLYSSVGRALHWYRGGHSFDSCWSPDILQASSLQLLKLENLLWWSLFTFFYNCSTIWISYIFHTANFVGYFQNLVYPEQKVVNVGQFRIGVCHGHQIVPWGDAEALAMVREFPYLIYWLCKSTLLDILSVNLEKCPFKPFYHQNDLLVSLWIRIWTLWAYSQIKLSFCCVLNMYVCKKPTWVSQNWFKNFILLLYS
mgnify:CR=1 FL=1